MGLCFESCSITLDETCVFCKIVSIFCLANLGSESLSLKCKNERLDTVGPHKTSFSLKFEFKCIRVSTFGDLWSCCFQLSDFCWPGEKFKIQYFSWRSLGTPVERPRAFVKPAILISIIINLRSGMVPAQSATLCALGGGTKAYGGGWVGRRAWKMCCKFHSGSHTFSEDQMCCELQHLGSHTFSEDQMCCKLQHLGSHALSEDQMCCNFQQLGSHTFSEDQICCKLQHLGSHAFSEDQVSCKLQSSGYQALSED